MLSVPSSDAQASSVFALTVLVASWVAELCVAQLPFPSVFALTLVVNAPAIRTAIEVAQFKRTIVAAVFQFAVAFLGVRVELAVIGTGWKTWNSRFIFNGAILSGPALFADANAFRTESVIGARRISAINLVAEAAFEAACTRTLSADAVTMTIAIRHFTLVMR